MLTAAQVELQAFWSIISKSTDTTSRTLQMQLPQTMYVLLRSTDERQTKLLCRNDTALQEPCNLIRNLQ